MQNEEVIHQIELSRIRPFPEHPFQVRDDAMQQTVESIQSYGVLVPGIVRPLDDDSYEIVAGHRRKHACELAGLSTMPAIVRNLNRDEATIIMVRQSSGNGTDRWRTGFDRKGRSHALCRV